MEEEHGPESGGESEVSGTELHEMFIEEPEDSPGDELDGVQAEQPISDVPSEGLMQQMPVGAARPRRQPDSSPRHKCTLVDPNTGEPCNADFSRAG